MRKLILAAVAVATTLPAMTVATTANARRHYYNDDNRNQNNQYREWRGADGRYYCRRPDGTTGAVVGAVGGALIGRTIDTRGDRTLGTLGGAIAGGLAGRAIERGSGNRQCR